MRIRIIFDDYRTLMWNIRGRVESGEWDTWKVDKVLLSDGNSVRRLVHVPSHDNQFEMIQIKLCIPSKKDIIEDKHYLDMVPAVKEGVSLSNEELYNKSAVVLGRWCEILNRYFPHVSEYHVYLKD